MYVATKPHVFDCGETAPDGSWWEIFGERYDRNPRFDLTPLDFHLVDVWAEWCHGRLPEAGGIYDQSAIMVDALNAMTGAAERIAIGRGE